MTFTAIYTDSNFQVYKSWGADSILKKQRNYFKVVFLNFAIQNKFIFNGYTYFGYKNGDSVVVEVTDLVASEVGEEFSLSIMLGVPAIEVFQSTAILDGLQIDSVLSYNLPLTIPFSLNFSDYLPISSSNMFDVIDFDSDLYTYNIQSSSDKILQNGSILQLKPIDCTADYAMMWWKDSLGHEKAWLFKKNLLNFGSKKQLDIETGDINYKQLRQKEYGCQLIHRNANHTTQMYISDIVMSDEVYIILGSDKVKIPVKIDETKFDVQRRNKDITINVNIAHYDTI